VDLRDPLWLAVVGLLLGVVGAAIGTTQRRLLIYGMPYFAVLHRLPIGIGTHSIRLDALAAVLLSLGLFSEFITGRRRPYVDGATWFLAAVLVLNVVATELYSPTKGFSITSILSLMSVWAVYVVVTNCLTTRKELDQFVTSMLVAGLLEATVGILAFLLAAAGLNIGGATYIAANDLTNAFGAYGTMWEPNIFGGYCACCLLLAMSLLWTVPHEMSTDRRQLVGAVAATSALGLLLSFTRGAWLAALISLMVLGVIGMRRTGRKLPVRRIVAVVAALVIMFAVALLAPGSAGEFLRYKLENLANPQSQSGLSRLMVSTIALAQWIKHPWIGLGTYTFAANAFGASFAQYKEIRMLWISNFVVSALHDTGVIGLAALLGMLVTVIRAGIRASRQWWPVNRPSGAVAMGLTAIVFAIMIASFFSSSLSLGYPWMFMGAIGAYARLGKTVSRPRPDPARVPRPTPRTPRRPPVAAGEPVAVPRSAST
jgi:putative inorganic carbon (HCO3(-)) transporter